MGDRLPQGGTCFRVSGLLAAVVLCVELSSQAKALCSCGEWLTVTERLQQPSQLIELHTWVQR